MAAVRPKRKAAGNKNYLDANYEVLLEDAFTKASTNGTTKTASTKRHSSLPSKSSTPIPKSGTGARIPYNWQSLSIAALGHFSSKLDLRDAEVDLELQTLVCPHMSPPELNFSGVDEIKKLEALLQKNLKGPAGGEQPAKNPKPQKTPHLKLEKGDFIYMVSEPPGEPYYVGRIMGFTRKDSNLEDQSSKATNFLFQIQWFYRPRDISKHTNDLRLLYALMHSDTCPLASYRGTVTVKHKSVIEEETKSIPAPYTNAIDYFASFPNCFYFDKLFDRYMIKFYDVITTSSLLQYINNSANNSKYFLLALSKRFEFIFMEPSRTKLFIHAFQSTLSSHCEICADWCVSNELITCSGCDNSFHMLCLDPPMLKKPSRGFSWSCAKCSKRHELEHRSKRILMLSHDNRTTNELELADLNEKLESPDEVELTDPAPVPKSGDNLMPAYEVKAKDFVESDQKFSAHTRRLREEWPLRYLGVHTRFEDAVDLTDGLPYPRASTSLGTKYQASNIPEYVDHPIVYYDPDESVSEKQKKATKKPPASGSRRKSPETEKPLSVPPEFASVDPRDYPQWLQKRPAGYIERGIDDGDGATCTVMWKPRPEDDEANLDSYLKQCEPIAESLELSPNSPNFVDAVLKTYMDCDGNSTVALKQVSQLTRKVLKEPTFNKEEVKRFESGVKKYGSELYPTYKEMRTQSCAMVVRFYYLWKKSKKGKLIWGNYPGRKKRAGKENRSEMKIKPAVDDYADSDDDSAYENEKIVSKNKLFHCKHCLTYVSPQWHKITGFDGTTVYDESNLTDEIDTDTVTALCARCARLWRRYAVYWEDPQDVERKNAKTSGAFKRKVEAELAVDAEEILRRSQSEGGGLLYDVNKKAITCSVTTNEPANGIANGTSNGDTKTATKSKPRTPPPAAKAPKERSAVKNEKTPPKPRLTSRQLSLSEKQISEKKEDLETKKRSAPVPKEDATTVKKKKTVVPKPTKAKAKPKRQPKVEPDAEPKIATPKTARKAAEAAEPAKPVKRQKKPEAPQRSTPVLSSLYEVPDLGVFAEAGKPLEVEKIATTHGLQRLIEIPALVAPESSDSKKLDFMSPPGSQPCAVCRTSEKSALSETLVCGLCGVNVHASCVGITIMGKHRPIRLWNCEVCLNDMYPIMSSDHACSLCLVNQEFLKTKLGAQNTEADYLVPVHECGRWCHLVCGVFSDQVLFRNTSTPAYMRKQVSLATNARGPASYIESISSAIVENSEHTCLSCGGGGGSLVHCEDDGCEVLSHVTCAQRTAGAVLGFAIQKAVSSKYGPVSFVGAKSGRLVPVFACADHAHQASVLSMRTCGSRSANGEKKPLIQMFLEDLARASASRLSGPQFRADNYIRMVSAHMRQQKLPLENATTSTALEGPPKVCLICAVSASPQWAQLADSAGEICLACKVNPGSLGERTRREGLALFQQLQGPLDGSPHGISAPDDHLTSTAHT